MSNNIHQTISFSNPVSEPLPELIAESIRQAINDEQLKPGRQLPGEPQFATQLGVSRTTLRDAVRILVSEGILERRRGVGTFVTDNPLVNIHEGLETLLGTTTLIRKKGYIPGTSESKWETIAAPEHLAEILEIPPGTPLIHLSRTRTANDIPVIHCEEYLPVTIIGPEKFKGASGDWSLYKLLKEAGSSVVSAVCKLTPVVADQRLAACLHVHLHHPLLLLRQTHYAGDHRPILYCENYHNSSVIEFHLIRKF
jgi:GntR family transcriptional regulator